MFTSESTSVVRPPGSSDLNGRGGVDFRTAWCLVLLYAAFYAAITWVAHRLVLTPDVLAASWSSLPVEQAEVMRRQSERWRILGYGFLPILLVLKITFTAACVGIGSILAGWEVRFRNLFGAAAQAEVVFVIAALLHLIGVLFIVEVRTPMDYSTFYPLSALHFVRITEQNAWLTYMLKTANLFEVAYIALVASSLRPVLDMSLRSLFLLVFSAYGAGLALIVALVTFVSLVVL